MTQLEWIRFGAGLFITALALIAEHYYFLNQRLGRVTCYVWGVATIWLGLAIWLVPSPIFWLSLAFPAVAGAAVRWAYYDDAERNRDIRAEVRDGQ